MATNNPYYAGDADDMDDELPPGPGWCHFCGAETGEPCDEDCECGWCEMSETDRIRVELGENRRQEP